MIGTRIFKIDFEIAEIIEVKVVTRHLEINIAQLCNSGILAAVQYVNPRRAEFTSPIVLQHSSDLHIYQINITMPFILQRL